MSTARASRHVQTREGPDRCHTRTVTNDSSADPNWIDAVSGIIRRIATVEVLDRFKQLADDEVHEKSPGDLVTIADRACELALIPELQAVRNAPVVGEESVAADPSLIDQLGTAPNAWIVDPVDGTANFVKGSDDFAVMVAYTEGGATVAAWIWLPVTDMMVTAEQGSGTWRNGTRLQAPLGTPQRRGIVKDRYLPDTLKNPIAAATPTIERTLDRRCAGVEYLDMVNGDIDTLFYWRTHPWDHAPGTLLASEAGLRVGRLDGSPYLPGVAEKGLLTARPEIWDEIGPSLDTATAHARG